VLYHGGSVLIYNNASSSPVLVRHEGLADKVTKAPSFCDTPDSKDAVLHQFQCECLPISSYPQLTALFTDETQRTQRDQAVSAFATHLMQELFPMSSDVVSHPVWQDATFCVAGGCFKSMVHGMTCYDLDLWPCSEPDRLLLLEAFRNHPSASLVRETRFNTLFKVRAPDDLVHSVEIVTKVQPAALHGKLSGFDIALSCIGVTFQGGKVVDVSVHPDVAASLRQREPLLILPMPNAPYLLATAERVLRYADEFRFPFPHRQIGYLQQRFSAASVQEQEKLRVNYETTTRSGFWKQRVMTLFQLE